MKAYAGVAVALVFLFVAGCGAGPVTTSHAVRTTSPTHASTTAASTSAAPGTSVPAGTTDAPLPSGAPHADAPRLAVGDHWSRRVQWPDHVEYDNETVDGTERLTAGGGTYDTLRLVADESRPDGPGAQTTTWIRVPDLAAVQVVTQFGPQGAAATHTQVMSPPCDGAYPYGVGKKVSRSCIVHDAGTMGGQRTPDFASWHNYTLEVAAVENVSVPAGTLMAYKLLLSVENGDGSRTDITEWYAPAACGIVKEEYETGEGVRTTEMLAYSCASTA